MKPIPSRLWLLFAAITTLSWGVWGALIEAPEKAGFPATLGYSVWALTMIPCALVALAVVGWKLERDRRSILLGMSWVCLAPVARSFCFRLCALRPLTCSFPLFPSIPFSLWRYP